MRKLLIINGPNLNMLGRRDPKHYGSRTLADIEQMCKEAAKKADMELSFRQSNHEGEIVTWIQEALDVYDAIIINAGAYTHTSIAIFDALELHEIPIIEVHLSDPDKREKFRHVSYVRLAASEVVKGKGAEGYIESIEIADRLTS